tara:strand:- start:2131 stop:2448 length:318 start_codon:yes stop_codon:yes gene_type:complete
MTVQVCQENESLSFSNVRWSQILYFAEAFGWQPIGTVIDENPEWEGWYCFNDGQVVLHEDGINFAKALERGLSEAPQRGEIGFEQFKKQVEELIIFAKKDEFSIY